MIITINIVVTLNIILKYSCNLKYKLLIITIKYKHYYNF